MACKKFRIPRKEKKKVKAWVKKITLGLQAKIDQSTYTYHRTGIYKICGNSMSMATWMYSTPYLKDIISILDSTDSYKEVTINKGCSIGPSCTLLLSEQYSAPREAE